MADVPYIAPGDRVTHDHWNDLVAAANAKAINLWGGMSPMFWSGLGPLGGDARFKRKFFFFNARPVKPYLSPGENLIGTLCDSMPGGGEQWFRKYDHAPFAWWASHAPIATQGIDYRPVQADDYPVVRCNQPNFAGVDWSAWLFPLGEPAGLVGDSYLPIDGLQMSLEAHQKLVTPLAGGNPTPHYIHVDGIQTEHVDLWNPIDVVIGPDIGASFTWPANYNRYCFIRFTNAQTQDLTISMLNPDGTTNLQATLFPNSSLCVRRYNGRWIGGYHYFFLPCKDDPWFLSGRDEPKSLDTITAGYQEEDYSNITAPFCIQALAAIVVKSGSGEDLAYDGTLFNRRLDGTKFQDISGIYTGTNKLYGHINDATPIGELLAHKGALMVVPREHPFQIDTTQTVKVPVVPSIVTLLDDENQPALGVQNFSVSKGGTSVPAVAQDGHTNWKLTHVVQGNEHWEVEFNPAPITGATTVHPDDEVSLSFNSTRDRYVFDFGNMANLGTRLAKAGITLSQSISNEGQLDETHYWTLTAAQQTDLISLGTDLIPVAFGGPIAVTLNSTPLQAVNFPWDPRGIAVAVEPVTRTFQAAYFDGNDALQFVSVDSTELDYVIDPAWRTRTVDMFMNLGDFLSPIRSYAFSGLMSGTADVKMTVHGPVIYVHQEMAVQWPMYASRESNTIFPTWFALKNDGGWKLVRDITSPLVSAQWRHLSQGNAGTWPESYGGLEFLDLSWWQVHFPRHEQYWIQRRPVLHRLANEPMAVPTGGNYTSEEPPFQKALSEMKPFAIGDSDKSEKLLPMGRIDNTPQRKNRCLVKKRFFKQNDVWTRMAAWASFGKLAYYDLAISGDSLQEYEIDYTKGTGAYNGYYGNARSAILANTPSADDLAIGHNALPLQAEHFNTIAGMVNGSVNTLSRPYVCQEEHNSATQLGFVPGFVQMGIGTYRLRPRNQYVGWMAAGGEDLVAAWWEAQGVTVKTASNFPGPWNTMLSGIQTFAWVGQDSEGNYVLQSGTLRPGDTDVTPLYQLWAPGANDIQARYRWVTLADAAQVFGAIGMPWGFEELVAPMRLKVVDGSAVLQHRDGQGINGAPLTACVWVNESNGDWVMNPDVAGRIGPIIRANVSQTDTIDASSVSPQGYSVGLTFGQDVETRLYNIGDFGESRPCRCQYIPGNRYYLYRRYGTTQPGGWIPDAYIAVWPRNFIDFERLTHSQYSDHIPRIPKGSIEGAAPTIIQTNGAQETLISTACENAELTVWKAPRPI